MPTIYGIDVSQYQQAVNWTKVKAGGKSFVFIRLGWAGWDGPIKQDTMFTKHIEGAKAAGLGVGVYVYSYCKTPAAAQLAAKQALQMLAPYAPLAYPVAFDIEDTSDAGTRYDKMTKPQNNAICKAFLDEIQKGGYYGILYTYKSFAEGYLNVADLTMYDTWIAQYAETCTYKGAYGIWQYAGTTGSCDGVTGSCDLNVAYKDYASIIKAAGLNGFAKQKPQEQPELAQLLASAETTLEKLQQNTAALEESLAKIRAQIISK